MKILAYIAEYLRLSALQQRGAAARLELQRNRILRLFEACLEGPASKKPRRKLKLPGQLPERQLSQFLKANYQQMTNPELAAAVNMRLTSLRNKLYSMGLKRCDQEYWTDAEILLLRTHYQAIGDRELAVMLTRESLTGKTWTHKMIWKKRQYLYLKRTKKQLKAIMQRNTQRGCFADNSAAADVRRIPEGHIVVRIQKTTGYRNKWIKIDTGFINLGRYNWQINYGPIPSGYLISYKDGDPLNCEPSNLICTTRGEISSGNKREAVKFYRQVVELLGKEVIQEINDKVKARKRLSVARKQILKKQLLQQLMDKAIARQAKQLKAGKLLKQQAALRLEQKAANRRVKLEAERQKVKRVLLPHTPKEKLASVAQKMNEGKVRIWIDHKTCVLVSPDRVEKTRAKYGLTAAGRPR